MNNGEDRIRDISMENFGQPRLIIDCNDISQCDRRKQQILNNQAIVEKVTNLDWNYLIQCLRVGINSSYDKFKNDGKDTDEFVNLIGNIIKLKDTLHSGDKTP